MTARDPMTAPHDPRELDGVIARLSKAQRKALLGAYETVFMDRMKCRGKMKSLRDMGLTTLAWRGGDLLTPLGEAIRARLGEQTDAN